MSNNLSYNQFIYCIYKDNEVQDLSSDFIGNRSAKIDHYLCFVFARPTPISIGLFAFTVPSISQLT